MDRHVRSWLAGLLLTAAAVGLAGCGGQATDPGSPGYDLFLERGLEISGLLPRTVYVVKVTRDGGLEHLERAFSSERGRIAVSPPPHRWDQWRGAQVEVYLFPGTSPVGLVQVPPLRGEVALAAMWVGVDGARPSDWVYLTVGRETYRTLSTPSGSAYFELADHYPGPEYLARSGAIILSQDLDGGAVRTVVHHAPDGAPALRLNVTASDAHGQSLDPMALPVDVRSTLVVGVADDVGRPLAGAEVHSGWDGRLIHTDSRGRAVIGLTPVAGEAFRVEVRMPGYAVGTVHAVALGRDDRLIEVLVPGARTLDGLAVYLFTREGSGHRLVDSAVLLEPSTDRVFLVGPAGEPLSVLGLGAAGDAGWRWEIEAALYAGERRSILLSTDDPGLAPLTITASVGEGDLDVSAALEAEGGPNPPGFSVPAGEVRGEGSVTFKVTAGTYVVHAHGYIDDGTAYVFGPRPLRVDAPGASLDLTAMPGMAVPVRQTLPGGGVLSGLDLHLPYSRARGPRILLEPGRYLAEVRATMLIGPGPSGWLNVMSPVPAELVVLPGAAVDLAAGDQIRPHVDIQELKPGGTLRAEIVFSDGHGNRLLEVRTPGGVDVAPWYRVVDQSGRIVATGSGLWIETAWPPPGGGWVLEVVWDTGPLAGVVRGQFLLDDQTDDGRPGPQGGDPR